MMSGPAASILKTFLQPYYEVRLRSDGIVWLARRRVPFPAIQAVHEAYDTFLASVDDWLLERRIGLGLIGTRRKAPMAWLFDMREAPDMRNDPAFEEVVKQRRPDLLERSPALAILVGTSAGQMQLKRITRDENVVLGVFSDEDESVSWLLRRIKESFK